jgi:hypothetical protein
MSRAKVNVACGVERLESPCGDGLVTADICFGYHS